MRNLVLSFIGILVISGFCGLCYWAGYNGGLSRQPICNCDDAYSDSKAEFESTIKNYQELLNDCTKRIVAGTEVK
ncbi:MAG: hypothetical protein WC449_05400 [Candidatus Paceibacterota bacterium]